MCDRRVALLDADARHSTRRLSDPRSPWYETPETCGRQAKSMGESQNRSNQNGVAKICTDAKASRSISEPPDAAKTAGVPLDHTSRGGEDKLSSCRGFTTFGQFFPDLSAMEAGKTRVSIHKEFPQGGNH